MSKDRSGREEFDWLKKAKSRLWARQADVSRVPGIPLLLSTFFYTGLSPVASGTVGSLAAALLYYFIPSLQNPIALLIACIVVLAVGTWSAGVTEKSLGEQDPGIVVIDEVLGQWLALVSWVYSGDLVFTILAFLFFRFFDIIKLWPARFFERREGGAGIMLDDAVAGIYANIAAHIATLVLQRLLYHAWL